MKEQQGQKSQQVILLKFEPPPSFEKEFSDWIVEILEQGETKEVEKEINLQVKE